MSDAPTHAWPCHGVAFREAVRTWAYVGLLSFGGPAAQIAVMHRVVVDEKRWIGEERFLHALNYCMLLPGPEAMQLATYIGWLMHRTRGALVAGLLFILPGFICMMALSVVYALYHQTPIVAALFYGIKPAVLAIVVQAVIRIGRRALPDRAMLGIAGASFVATFIFRVPFPVLILGAIALGLGGSGLWPETFKPGKLHAKTGVHSEPISPLLSDDAVLPVSRSLWRTLRVAAIWLAIWLVPLALAGAAFGFRSTVFESGVFFSKAAVVTFGGAYAVLGYVAQHAPNAGWLLPGEMLDGLGMAETTPGPLIMVLQFVGFMASYRSPATLGSGGMIELSPMWSGVVGAALATWTTFAPCFMWIFLGAPYMEHLRHNRRIGAALACVTAAVVGVILSLSLWFAMNTLFASGASDLRFGPATIPVPIWRSFDIGSGFLALFAAFIAFRSKWSLIRVVGICAGVGVLVWLLRLSLLWNVD